MEHAQPKLLIPQLQSFYRWAEPLSWALVRITAGLMLIPHGWPKLMMGIDATAQMALVKRGIAPAEPLAVVLITLETLGGLCVALGLFTRFWAATIAVVANYAAGRGDSAHAIPLDKIGAILDEAMGRVRRIIEKVCEE